MEYSKSRQYEETAQSREYPTPPLQRQSQSGSVMLGLSIVAAVMFGSLFFSGFNVAITVVSTIVFYGGVIVLTMLIDSGALDRILNKREEERTKREHIRMVYAHEQPPRVSLVEYPQLPYMEPVEPTPQLPAPTTFVAPMAEPDDSAKREAVGWLLQLYGGDGHPDAKKVLMQSDKERPGRIRIAAPSKPAKEYLLERHIIHDLGNGYRLNLVRVPTINAARNLVSLPNGVGGYATRESLPTPLAESGGA